MKKEMHFLVENNDERGGRPYCVLQNEPTQRVSCDPRRSKMTAKKRKRKRIQEKVKDAEREIEKDWKKIMRNE